MQIPKSWDDEDLLKYEPFYSRLTKSRRTTRKSANPEIDEHWINQIVVALKKITGYEEVLQQWLFYALPEKNKEKKKSKSIHKLSAYFKSEDEALTLFTRVYWYLSRNSDSEKLEARTTFDEVRRRVGQKVKARSTTVQKNSTAKKRKAKDQPLKAAKHKKPRKDHDIGDITESQSELQVPPVVTCVEHAINDKDEIRTGKAGVDIGTIQTSSFSENEYNSDPSLHYDMSMPWLVFSEFEFSEDDKGFLSDISLTSTRCTPDEALLAESITGNLPNNSESIQIRTPAPRNETALTPTTSELCIQKQCVAKPNAQHAYDHIVSKPSSRTTSPLTEISSQIAVGSEDINHSVITLDAPSHYSRNLNILEDMSSQPGEIVDEIEKQVKKRKIEKIVSSLAATRLAVSQNAAAGEACTDMDTSKNNVDMQRESLKRTSGRTYSIDEKTTSLNHMPESGVQIEMLPGCYNHGMETLNFRDRLEKFGSSQITTLEPNGSINDVAVLPPLDAAFSENPNSSKKSANEINSRSNHGGNLIFNGNNKDWRDRRYRSSSPYSKRGRKHDHITKKRASSTFVDAGNSKFEKDTEDTSKDAVKTNFQTSKAVKYTGSDGTLNYKKKEFCFIKVDPAKEMLECDDSLSESSDDEIVLKEITTDAKSFCTDSKQKNSEEKQELHYEKPELPLGIRPPIWAASRQELCESFPWFRSYQSGVYHPKGVVKGYLLSAFSSKRDKFFHGGKLIISHGGGSSKILRVNGQLFSVISEDQDFTDLSVRALLRAHKQSSPIVLIMDDKYRLFPYTLRECIYAVLGYYWITNAWAEPEESNNERGSCIKYKFSFQWCESQGEPWWIISSKNIPCEVKEKYYTSTAKEQECQDCNNMSPIIYEHGWMCLNPQCSNFWRPQIIISLRCDNEYIYSADFLKLRKTPACLEYIKRLETRPLAQIRNGIITSQDLAKGWWCQYCGKLSCRENWECWRCSCCGNVIKIKGRIRDPKEFWPQQHGLRFMHDRIHPDSGITRAYHRWQSSDGCGSVLSFTFPHGRGTIYIVLGNPFVNSRANELFQLYQEQALEKSFFRRYPLQSHALRGRMLANYFSQNSGAPYKYVAGTGDTTPFDSAPSAVTSALQLIKQRSALVLGKEEDFNEILSAAYMEKQKMAFHSDSEPGLGPVVCSLSLGSVAMMHFRLQSSLVSSDEQRRRELTLVLRHGDVLVMNGIEIQTKYEHTVVPLDFRIAATARRINQSNSVQKAELL